MAIIFPEIPPMLRGFFPIQYWNYWQAFKSYMLQGLSTQSDVTVLIKGKGIVLTNAAGTVTKRVRLNDAGDGLIFENV